MSRYIDADKQKNLIDYSADLGGKLGEVITTIKKYAKDMVDATPTADVVEVVRCDQCRHFEAINNDDHGWCKLISDLPIGVSVRYNDDYCSYGEGEEE